MKMNMLTESIRKFMGWCPNAKAYEARQHVHLKNTNSDTPERARRKNKDTKISKTTLAVIGLVFLSFVLSICFYSLMPEQMATHWNFQGEVDGYMSKFWGLFLTPVVIAGLAIMFLVIPRIDPRKEKIAALGIYYDGTAVIVILFMVIFHLQILLWNVGTRISLNFILSAGIGLLFYYIGILMENVEKNWFIGIRTPWTLSSDRVWKKTHRLGSKLFRIAGIIAILGVFFSRLAVFFIVVPAFLVTGLTVVYSYIEYKKIQRDEESDLKS